jgi:hypothetical protein
VISVFPGGAVQDLMGQERLLPEGDQPARVQVLWLDAEVVDVRDGASPQ